MTKKELQGLCYHVNGAIGIALALVFALEKEWGPGLIVLLLGAWYLKTGSELMKL